MNYSTGSLVKSIHGESDTDDNNVERNTGANAWGHIHHWHASTGYEVWFVNGTCVWLTQDELDDRKRYDVCEPDAMAGRLQEVREKQDEWAAMDEVPDVFAYLEVLDIVCA